MDNKTELYNVGQWWDINSSISSFNIVKHPGTRELHSAIQGWMESIHHHVKGRKHRTKLWQSQYPLVLTPTSILQLWQMVANYPPKKMQLVGLWCEKIQLIFSLGLAVFELRDFMRIDTMLDIKRVKAQLCSIFWRLYSPGPKGWSLEVLCASALLQSSSGGLSGIFYCRLQICVRFILVAWPCPGMAVECKWKEILSVSTPVCP